MPKADHPYAHGSHIAMENEKQNTLFRKTTSFLIPAVLPSKSRTKPISG